MTCVLLLQSYFQSKDAKYEAAKRNGKIVVVLLSVSVGIFAIVWSGGWITWGFFMPYFVEGF